MIDLEAYCIALQLDPEKLEVSRYRIGDFGETRYRAELTEPVDAPIQLVGDADNVGEALANLAFMVVALRNCGKGIHCVSTQPGET